MVLSCVSGERLNQCLRPHLLRQGPCQTHYYITDHLNLLDYRLTYRRQVLGQELVKGRNQLFEVNSVLLDLIQLMIQKNEFLPLLGCHQDQTCGQGVQVSQVPTILYLRLSLLPYQSRLGWILRRVQCQVRLRVANVEVGRANQLEKALSIPLIVPRRSHLMGQAIPHYQDLRCEHPDLKTHLNLRPIWLSRQV